MSGRPDIQAQLRALSIPKEQRPMGAAEAHRRSRRALMIVFAIVFVGVILTGYTFRESITTVVSKLQVAGAEAPPVRLVQVMAGREAEQSSVLTATGKIVSDHLVSVSTKVSGQIVALYFEQGDRVEVGQRLAQIEDVIYRARRDEAAARLQRSHAALAFQRVNYERIVALVQSASAPDIEYDDAKRALAEAEAQVAADRATLAYTEKTFSDCEVVTPTAGVVLTRDVEVGDFVAAEGGRGANANAQFATIADMTKLRVEVDISELDIIRIHKDMPCIIIPDAYKERRYGGYVLWIDPGANYSKATVQVKVRIDNPDEYLRVEGSAQVSFLSDKPSTDLAEEKLTIWIPASACLIDPGGQSGSVFVAVEGRLRRTTVGFGRRSGDRLEVVSGLIAGQSIVAEGLDRISDGERVRL